MKYSVFLRDKIKYIMKYYIAINTKQYERDTCMKKKIFTHFIPSIFIILRLLIVVIRIYGFVVDRDLKDVLRDLKSIYRTIVNSR